MAFHKQEFDPNDDESFDKMRDFFSPAHIDQTVRQAIQFCWMMLPREKRNIDEIERQIRRIVDRALKDLRDDEQAFWRGSDA
ncbi:MAG: hypothetical protein JW888_08365 [Pirellulales bacterium]|nr:hypothetical protein [Pirellulales bacterium]